MKKDFFKINNFLTKQLETHEELIASLLGGVVSGFSTVPLDVMVAQIQQASKAGQKVKIQKKKKCCQLNNQLQIEIVSKYKHLNIFTFKYIHSKFIHYC